MQHPDRLESGIRIGCGGLLGLAIGLRMVLFSHHGSSAWWVGTVAVCVVVCALAAHRWGDRFWLALRWMRWWR